VFSEYGLKLIRKQSRFGHVHLCTVISELVTILNMKTAQFGHPMVHFGYEHCFEPSQGFVSQSSISPLEVWEFYLRYLFLSGKSFELLLFVYAAVS